MRYTIQGEPLPVVICELDSGESMVSEAGSMSWMTPGVEMQTASGGAGKIFGRIFSGETMFQNLYTARNGPGSIAAEVCQQHNLRAVRLVACKVADLQNVV